MEPQLKPVPTGNGPFRGWPQAADTTILGLGAVGLARVGPTTPKHRARDWARRPCGSASVGPDGPAAPLAARQVTLEFLVLVGADTRPNRR